MPVLSASGPTRTRRDIQKLRPAKTATWPRPAADPRNPRLGPADWRRSPCARSPPSPDRHPDPPAGRPRTPGPERIAPPRSPRLPSSWPLSLAPGQTPPVSWPQPLERGQTPPASWPRPLARGQTPPDAGLPAGPMWCQSPPSPGR